MSDLVIDVIAAVGVASSTLVTIELTDGRGDPVVGYVDGTPDVIILPTTVTTDANGQVTVDLIPNTSIVPGNSCYTVRIAHKQFLIQKSGATQTLFEALVNDPGDLDPINTDFLLRENNLSDLDDVSVARDNLGLGDSATLNVGTTAGTVAAGDDPRFDIAPDHIADPTDAHDATAISFAPTVSIPADDVQEAIEYVMANASGGGGTNDHNALINRGAADQHPASSVTNTPAGTISATHVQAAINELDGDIQGHITDTVDAHDASAISLVPFSTISATDVQNGLQQVYAAAVSGLDEASEISFAPTGDITSTNVQTAIVEVDGELHAHEALATDAHDASAISFVPTGGITSVNAQTAIVEALTDSLAYTDAHINDTVDAHDASAISFVPTGTISATDVQAAIAEVASDAAAGFVPVDGTYAASGTDVVSSRVTGNAVARWTVDADGTHNWGDGTAAQDTNLYRSAANVLKTDDTFQSIAVQLPNAGKLSGRDSSNSTYVDVATLSAADKVVLGGQTGNQGTELRAAGSKTVQILVGSTVLATLDTTSSAQLRTGSNAALVVGSDANGTAATGGIKFGSSSDTNLYRAGTDFLKTDDKFQAVLSQTDPVQETKHNFQFLITQNTLSSSAIANLSAQVLLNAGSANQTGQLSGISMTAGTGASYSGTATLMVGFQNQIFAQAGTITTGRGINIDGPFGAGTIVNSQGIRIANMGNTGTTNTFGLSVEAQTTGTNAYGVAIGASTTSTLWVSQNTNSTTAPGGIHFGSSRDTNLYRSATDTLKTDDSFVVGTALQVVGNSGFYNTTPIAQPSTTGESAGFTAGAGTTATHLSTFTGNSGTKAYTVSDIVKHLKALGLLASS